MKQKNWVVETKKIFFLINLFPRVPSFYIRTKFRLKNCVTTVHLLQCKTNFFTHLCFEGEIYCKLKNIHLGKLPLISKKRFFDSFTLVHIRLDSSSDSSTLVYIHLDLSSVSSTLFYFRLHPSTFVYTRIHSSRNSSVFLQQIGCCRLLQT